MFTSLKPDEPSVVCEDCYRLHYYGKESYSKQYKHCVLDESITSEKSRDLCHCKTVPHHDDSGQPLSLFPVKNGDNHLDVGGSGTIQCTLLKLGELVAGAKFNGLQDIVGIKDAKASTMLAKEVAAVKSVVKADIAAQTSREKTEKRKSTAASSSKDTANSGTAPNSTSVVTEAETDTDIPLFFRRFTTKYPFADVHMALRVGPLVIENGVAQ